MTAPVTVPWVLSRLHGEYGRLTRKRLGPLSELVLTVLSQNTSDVNSGRAYASLRARYPRWASLLNADERSIADAIRSGGLSDVKAARIKAMMNRIRQLRGSLDLAFLRDIPLEQAKRWLVDLPGVGPKTAACVLLFSLGRPALPVDTHVLRLARRLGLVPEKASAEKAQRILESVSAPDQVFYLHLALIRHGRTVCKARRPLCARCVLNVRCPSAFTFTG